MREVSVETLVIVVKSVLEQLEVPTEHAKIVSDSVLFAHQTGKDTHGITRLPIYVKKIKNGGLNPKSSFSFVNDKGVASVLDANHGFGQVAAHFALERAIEKAKAFGLGAVAVRNSNNFGTAAYFLNSAVQKGMIAIIMANSAPAIAPWGGNQALLGTNPIGFGFPVKKGAPPLIFDMATSFAARGKIRLAAKNDEKIPFGWALDANGNPTDDPIEAIKGTLIPIGEHKGSGLSLVIDILSGLLSGSAHAGGVKPLNTDGDFSRNGHFVLAINIDFFLDYEDYLKNMDFLLSRYKETGKSGNVFYPGEKACANAERNHHTVQLREKLITEINDLLSQMSLNIRL